MIPGTMRFAAVLLPLALATVGRAQAVEHQVRTQVERYVAAINSGNAGAVASLYLNEPSTSSVGDGQIHRGWQRVADLLRHLYEQVGPIRMTSDSVSITTLGTDAALAVLRYRWAFERVGAGPVTGAMTLVYARTPQGWRVAHDHTSTLQPVTAPVGAMAAVVDSAPASPRRPTVACTVTRITDGDGIVCNRIGRVRLIGIDTPEMDQQPFGPQAATALGEMIRVGSVVQLEPDVEERDRYGRVLAYVWVGRTMATGAWSATDGRSCSPTSLTCSMWRPSPMPSVALAKRSVGCGRAGDSSAAPVIIAEAVVSVRREAGGVSSVSVRNFSDRASVRGARRWHGASYPRRHAQRSSHLVSRDISMQSSRHWIVRVLALTVSVSSPYAVAKAQRPSRAALQRTVDSLVASALTEGPVAGMSVAVVRGRDTVVMKGYGFADVENDVRATPQTVYRIGSITKQFTAAAVLQLAEQGKVWVDDTIGGRLPTLPPTWRKATIRQLLNHTSGIPSYTSAGPRWASRMRIDLPHDSLIGIVANDSMDFPLGTQWRYNNTGYYLLGMLIEQLTGRSYAEVVRDQLVKPLGLQATMYCGTRPVIKRRAQGYQLDQDEKLVNAAPLSMNQPFAAGALCSTVGDLVAWQRALAGGRVVKAESYTSMITPQGAASGPGYGYGLSRDTLAGRTRIQHGGGINGFNSMLQYFPSDTLSIAVLVNTNGPWADRVANNIARAALGVPLVASPAPLADLPTTAEERARFAGTYRLALPNGRTLNLRVFERDGKLMSQGDGQGEIPLRYQGNSVFGASFDRSMRLTFAPGTPAPKVILLQGGATIDGPRAQ